MVAIKKHWKRFPSESPQDRRSGEGIPYLMKPDGCITVGTVQNRRTKDPLIIFAKNGQRGKVSKLNGDNREKLSEISFRLI